MREKGLHYLLRVNSVPVNFLHFFKELSRFSGSSFKNLKQIIEPGHEISNNVLCATSKGSDQLAHDRCSLIRSFASPLNILWLLAYWLNNILEFLSLKGYTGSSESIHVKIPHCWISHVAAHIIFTALVVNIQIDFKLIKQFKPRSEV